MKKVLMLLTIFTIVFPGVILAEEPKDTVERQKEEGYIYDDRRTYMNAVPRYEQSAAFHEAEFPGQRVVNSGKLFPDDQVPASENGKRKFPTFLVVGLSFFLILLIFSGISPWGLFTYIIGASISLLVYFVFDNIVFSQILAILCVLFTVYFVLVRETAQN